MSKDEGVADPHPALSRFSEPTRTWFGAAFAEPTPAQVGAWDAIGAGRNALVVAPTGSGKTLSAFLWSLDRLLSGPTPEGRTHRTRGARRTLRAVTPAADGKKRGAQQRWHKANSLQET